MFQVWLFVLMAANIAVVNGLNAGNVPNEVKNMIADKLPYSLPDVNRGQYGNFELKNVRLIRFDYASASVSMENTKVTVQLNDAVLEFIGFVRAWYNIVLEFSSRGDFKVQTARMNVVIRGHLANNGVHFDDDAIPVFTIGEMHVWLSNTGLPGFVERIVEGQLEGRKDQFAGLARPVIVNLLKQRGTIALPA